MKELKGGIPIGSFKNDISVSDWYGSIGFDPSILDKSPVWIS